MGLGTDNKQDNETKRSGRFHHVQVAKSRSFWIWISEIQRSFIGAPFPCGDGYGRYLEPPLPFWNLWKRN